MLEGLMFENFRKIFMEGTIAGCAGSSKIALKVFRTWKYESTMRPVKSKASVLPPPPTPHTASNAHSKLFCPLVCRFVDTLSCDHILGRISHIYLTNWRGLPEFCHPFVVLCHELDLVPSSLNINIVYSVGWSVWQNSEYVDNCRLEKVLYSFIMSVMAAVA